jgi:D-alanyl-lipoteichoic acid acyltransferase DltB (MBOAT superfamily)
VLFNSFIFLGFLAVVLTVYWLLRLPKYQNPFLLVASLFFYGYGGPRFVLLLLLCAGTAYVVGLVIAARPRYATPALVVGTVVSLGILFVYKYFNFFIETVASRLEFIGIDVSNITLRLALPIGISFFTFQAVGYMADVHRGKVAAERNAINLFLFISFFPQLVAGPIERADHLLQEFKKKRQLTDTDVGYGVYLIIQGYVKKIVIADNLKPFVDTLFAYEDLSAPLIIAGLLGFTFQIYGDFSGYTDIARGVAKLMGFDLLLNFRRPYWSASPTEFWRRWHITLSNWFRDYVYITLGGNRKSPSRVQLNIFLTMVLSGLWHGASANFVVWGAYHGALLIGHKAWLTMRGKEPSQLHGWRRVPAVALMFALTVYGWMLFRITEWSQITGYTEALFTDWSFGALGVLTLFSMLPYIALSVFVDVAEAWSLSEKPQPRMRESWALAPYLASLALLVVALGSDSGGEFIYFKF